jgi:hypothetical protein
VNEFSAREKVLYHQIHPAKLGVDIGVTPVALYLFWIHSLVVALVVSLLPSVIASAIIVRIVDLSRYKESGFGRYVGRYMTRAIEAVRLAGFIVAAVGAWLHLWWLIPVGIAVVILGWLRGVILPQPQR